MRNEVKFYVMERGWDDVMEKAFSIVEQKYDLKLTTGIESFYAKVFERLNPEPWILRACVEKYPTDRNLPMEKIKTQEDVRELVDAIMLCTGGRGARAGEAYRIRAERHLFAAYIGFMLDFMPLSDMTFSTLSWMIRNSEVREDEEDYKHIMDDQFEKVQEIDPKAFSVRQYRKYNLIAGKDKGPVIFSCRARLDSFLAKLNRKKKEMVAEEQPDKPVMTEERMFAGALRDAVEKILPQHQNGSTEQKCSCPGIQLGAEIEDAFTTLLKSSWKRLQNTDEKEEAEKVATEKEEAREEMGEEERELIVTFHCIDSDHEKIPPRMVRLKAQRDDVRERLEDIIYRNRDHMEEKQKYLPESCYYCYKIIGQDGKEERETFDVDIHIVMEAFVLHFADLITYLDLTYGRFIYKMKDIRAGEDSDFSSTKLYVTDSFRGGKRNFVLEDCSFHDFFQHPCCRWKSFFRQGSFRMSDWEIQVTFSFYPKGRNLPVKDPEDDKDGKILACYDGMVLLEDKQGYPIYRIKGEFLTSDSHRVFAPKGHLQLCSVFAALDYLCDLGMVPVRLTELKCCKAAQNRNGQWKEWKIWKNTVLETYCGRRIQCTFEDTSEVLKKLNVFLQGRKLVDTNRDYWDSVVDSLEEEDLPEQRIYSILITGDRRSLHCEFYSSGSIDFILNESSGLGEMSVKHICLTLRLAYQNTTIYLDLPWSDGWNGKLCFVPFRIYLDFGGKRPPILLDYLKNDDKMQMIWDEIHVQNWSVGDMLEQERGSEKAARLVKLLMTAEKKNHITKGVTGDGTEEDGKEHGIFDEVREILASDRNYHPDEKILRDICLASADYLFWKYRRNSYVGTKKPLLPNFAFLGNPGTGKSELVRRLAKEVFGAKFYETTPSELKALYIGHTRGVFLSKLDELQRQEGFPEDAPAVLFLDEAYTLFTNSDQRVESFDRDIIGLMLAVMQPREQTFSYQVEEDKTAVNKTVVVKANTVIWMAGYEKEMRKALSSNPGIFRRVSTILLPDPGLDNLWRRFWDNVQDVKEADKMIIQRKKPEIMKYFRWGTTMEHAEFFGNYSGARKLAENMRNTFLILDSNLSEERKEKELDYIIDAQKKEIHRQYRMVISNDGRLPFEVISELPENMSRYIGNDSVREQMREIVSMMANVEYYEKRHISIPKGALLKGYPGTGKTYLARCMAGELAKCLQEMGSHKKIAFIPVAATELRRADLISALFSAAGEYEEAILFIDEIDAIGQKREMLADATPLIQLMKEMDGFDDRKTIFVLAATNAPELLDPALKRAGRFDMEFEIRFPNQKERKELFGFYAKEVLGNIRPEILEKAGKAIRGCSPAEIRELINETALLYYRCENKLDRILKQEKITDNIVFVHRAVKGEDTYEGTVRVTWDGRDYWKADDKAAVNQDMFLLDLKETLARKEIGERHTGEKKEEGFQTEENKGRSSTAIHEVGHAMVYVWQNYQVEKVTVLARGDAAGYVELQNQHWNIETKKDYLVRIKAALGGRAAEELFYGDNVSNGAVDDLRKATDLARSMVIRHGMGTSVGIMSLVWDKENYLGNRSTYTCSAEYQAKADIEIQAILEDQYREVMAYLTEHKEQLRQLAEYVFEQEEISGEEFAAKCLNDLS